MAAARNPHADELAPFPTRADFEKLSAMIAAAVAQCEAAQEHFVWVDDALQRAIRERRTPTERLLSEQDRARRRLDDARACLSGCQEALKKSPRGT